MGKMLRTAGLARSGPERRGSRLSSWSGRSLERQSSNCSWPDPHRYSRCTRRLEFKPDARPAPDRKQTPGAPAGALRRQGQALATSQMARYAVRSSPRGIGKLMLRPFPHKAGRGFDGHRPQSREIEPIQQWSWMQRTGG